MTLEIHKELIVAITQSGFNKKTDLPRNDSFVPTKTVAANREGALCLEAGCL
jgi:hypothetical protein